jgi:cytochrome c biogenesis protein
MSTAQEFISPTEAKSAAAPKPRVSAPNRFLDMLSSVRLGIVLLILLGLACFLGMVIMQQNMSGFDRYYAELMPAQQIVYGYLGFFDIYHTWYFNALLLLLSLNIVLSSIDRFPSAWSYISRPKTDATDGWLKARKPTAHARFAGDCESAVAAAVSSLKAHGFKKTRATERDGRTVVFGERGAWNRLGAYAVHVGLLTIFAGGFMTTQIGQNGQMLLTPGQSSDKIQDVVFDLDRIKEVDKRIPFTVECLDIEQKLINNAGSINTQNTIDWMTRIRITDEYGSHDAVIQMNAPYDYRGYRFFQSSFVPTGRARNVTVEATPVEGGNTTRVVIPRNERLTLADGTVVRFVDFRANFNLGQEDPNEDTSHYPNPAAVLQVTAPGEVPQTAYAFGEDKKELPVASKIVGGYTFRLADFEKVGEAHILSVQRDPGADVVYVGFALLCATLIAVFFFAHQRVWIAVSPADGGDVTVLAGGDTNRNQAAFEEWFAKVIAAILGDEKEKFHEPRA